MDDVNELIRLGRGDVGRLNHIKNTLENKRTLFESDRIYAEESIAKYLVTQEKSDVGTKPDSVIESSYKPKFCRKCGVSLPDDGDFCVECGTRIMSEANSGNTDNKSINKEYSIKPKKRRRIGIKKAIGITIGVFFLLILVASTASVANDEGLTQEQKSIIQIMKDSCSNNMAYFQSNEAGQMVEQKCMKKVEEKIQEYKQMNEANSSP